MKTSEFGFKLNHSYYISWGRFERDFLMMYITGMDDNYLYFHAMDIGTDTNNLRVAFNSKTKMESPTYDSWKEVEAGLFISMLFESEIKIEIKQGG